MKHKNDLSFNTKFNGKQKFGFRKLSVGLAAVALSTTFFLSNSQLVAVWNNSISKDSPDYLDLTIPALANGSTVKSDLKNQAFNVEIDGKSQIAFTADLTPYKDKVTPTELIHGFAMGQKSFN